MDIFKNSIQWIESQKEEMITLLIEWVNINSGSDNLEGLEKQLASIQQTFRRLGAEEEVISLPSSTKIDTMGNYTKRPVGKALQFTKRQNAPLQILLVGHMDTVFTSHSPFQKAKRDNDTLVGPGALDMKGGLIIMLKALEALERTEQKKQIGWQVIINPDEEIGSVSSEKLLYEAATNHDIGLIFEPSFPDGYLVSSRKGSINFSIVSKGISAHAGRDFHEGKNAIQHLVRLLAKIETLNNYSSSLTVNLGHIEGGGPVNIVPDLAICRCNARFGSSEEAEYLKEKLSLAIGEENEDPHVNLELFVDTARAHKSFDQKHEELFLIYKQCAKELSQELMWRPSGGVCDGNILALAGLPVIDTLGGIGSGMHTFNETIHLNSLVDRAKLTTFFLLKMATNTTDFQKWKRRM